MKRFSKIMISMLIIAVMLCQMLPVGIFVSAAGASGEPTYQYKAVQTITPGKTYLIGDGYGTAGQKVNLVGVPDELSERANVASGSATASDGYVISDFEGSEKYEWTAVAGMGENSGLPSTVMFQNPDTGAWLYNPVYDTAGGGDVLMMTVTLDPMTDDYSGYTRQIFNSQAAMNAYVTTAGNGGGGKATLAPNWVVVASNTATAANDPKVYFHMGGLSGATYNYVGVVGHENAKDTDVFAFYLNENPALGSSEQNKFAQNFGENWTAKQLPGDLSVSTKPDSWIHLRFDINSTSNQIFISSVFAARNAHAFTALKSFRRSIAWYSSNNGYQPSNRFPFAQFAVSTGSYNHTVGNFASSSVSASNKAGFVDQYYYGFTDGIFYATWNNKMNLSNTVFYEKTEVEAGNYEWQLVTEEGQIERGAEYVISADSTAEGKDVWTFNTIGDYYLITSKANGGNLATTDSPTGGVRTIAQAATGGAVPYTACYRWKYDAANSKLVVYNHPQNEGEALASYTYGAGDGSSLLTYNGSNPVYLYKKVYVEPEECAHPETTVTGIVEATCKNEGYTGDTVCAVCGFLVSKGTTTPKTAHGESVLANVVQATCKNEGYTGDMVCSVCGEVFEKGTTTPVTGHTPGDELHFYVAPTCTGEGWSGNRYCTVCDEGLPGEVIPALGHDHQHIRTVRPTCTEGGYDVYKCSRCDDGFNTNYVDALGHSYSEVVTAPTCTAGGYTTYTCTVCGDSYVGNETAKLEHSYEANVTKPTCTAGGFTSYTCSVCGDGYVSDEVSPLGHAYVETKTEATCTEDGSIVNVCSVCGDTVTETIPKKGHTEVTLEAKAPTCTETGLTEGKKCSVCGEVLVAQEVVPEKGHDYEAVVTKPTCTAGGYTTYTCTVCGDSYVSDEVSPLGHAYVETKTEATCTEDGSIVNVCSVCGDTVTETIPKKGHTEVTLEAKAPTCTETGLTEGKKCSVCGEITVAQEAVPEKGHDYEAVVTEPTCTENGYTTYTCSACGDEYIDDEVPATDHSYESIEKVDATVGADGYEIFKCTTCGDEYTDVIPALSEIYVTIYGENGEVISKQGYSSLNDAADASAEKTAVIDILTNVSAENVIMLEGNIIVNGNGFSVTSSASRVFRIKGDNTAVEMNAVNIVSEAVRKGSNDIRGIGIDSGYNGISVELNDCSVDFTDASASDWSYAVNNAANTNTTITINGGSYESANVINVWGDNITVEINDATLTSIYGVNDSFVGVGIKLEGTNTEVSANNTTISGSHAIAYDDAKGTNKAELDITDNTKFYVAKVGTEYFYTVGKAVEAAEAGSTVKLINNVDIDTVVIVDKDLTIDLNGKTVIGVDIYPVIRITNNANVTVKNGVINNEDYVFVLGASDGSSAGNLTIESGKYHGDCTVASVTKGTLTVNDGEFSVVPYEGSYKYLINCIDKNYKDGSAKVVINGGKFHNWNPQNNAAEGAGTNFMAEGLHATDADGDGVYTVGTHVEKIIPAVEATCTETGLTEGKECSECGEVLVAQEVVPEKGHRYSSVVTTSPTCTEAGYITITCGDCGKVFVSGIDAEADQYLIDYPFFKLDPLGHSYEAVVTEPTCTEGGYTTYTCSVCDDTYVADETEPAGHDYEAVVTEPTCTEGGYTTYTCSVCGDSYVADETEAAGHDYVETVEDATCLETGLITNTCSVCGDTTTEIIPEKGHSYKVTAIVPATCTEDGATVLECSACGDKVEGTIPATGHHHEAVVTEPTCTEGGFTTYTCPDCGDSYVTDETAAKGHRYSSVVTTSPTCTEAGYITITCGDCGKVFVSGIDAEADQYLIDYPFFKLDPLGHKEVVDAAIDATCTEDGLTEGSHCEVCGEIIVAQETVPATGHRYGGLVVHSATCTEDGYIEITCGNCNKTFVSGVDAEADKYLADMPFINVTAPGHKEVVDEAIDATCEESGLTEGSHCEVCGEIIVEQTVVPANGHDYEDTFTVDKAPTTEEAGSKSRHCKNCDAMTDVTEIPAIVIGDVDGDGKVNARDAILLKKYIAGNVSLEEVNVFNADLDCDGRISAADMIQLKKIVNR